MSNKIPKAFSEKMSSENDGKMTAINHPTGAPDFGPF